MSTKTLGIFGLNTSYATFLDYLPPSIEVDGVTVNIQQNPIMYVNPYSKDMIQSNCDYFINIRGDEYDVSRETEMLMGDRCTYIEREPKVQQLTKAFLCDSNIHVDIPICTSSDKERQYEGVDIPEDVEYVILKPMAGAKGECQAIIPVNQLSNFIDGEQFCEIKDLQTHYPDIKFFFSKDWHYDWNDELKNETGFTKSAWMVVPYVTDIHLEFRILRSGDNIRGYIRKRTEINNEMRVSVSGNHTCSDSMFPDYLSDRVTIEKWINFDHIIDFMNQLDFYYGSMDFYIKEDGTVGIFEYCPQHGTALITRDTAKTMCKEYLTYAIRKMMK